MAIVHLYQHGNSISHSISRMSPLLDFMDKSWLGREDMYAPESIELLKKSGIDFNRHENEGIDVNYFGELLVTSGLVLFDNVKWVSFHSWACPVQCDSSWQDRGYDFGYLMKILTCEPLPTDEDDFFRLLFLWFPCLYDIKHVIRSCKPLKGGLQEIAESLGVRLSWSLHTGSSWRYSSRG